ncbi:MAG TPA: MarC family protein [Paraburkholderia sp.]|nr:MarC family protein [Paraburkholderia sp.]
MEYTFVSATILLLLITDPLGNIPLFISCLRGVAKRRRAVVILREVAIAFVILLVFMVAGNSFLRMMGLTDTSLRIGGGIVLFLIALRMIFPHPGGLFGSDKGGEPLIVPLAIPALAGPSALATVMLLSSQAPGKTLEWIAALTVTMIVCAIVLVLAERIEALLGERVVTAFERLMGLVLVAISVEMILGGISKFVHQL